jgi:hypothetical protein
MVMREVLRSWQFRTDVGRPDICNQPGASDLNAAWPHPCLQAQTPFARGEPKPTASDPSQTPPGIRGFNPQRWILERLNLLLLGRGFRLAPWALGLGPWVLCLGPWALGVGCWVLGVGSWVLGVGSWVLGVGCWVLGVGCWVLGVGGAIKSR